MKLNNEWMNFTNPSNKPREFRAFAYSSFSIIGGSPYAWNLGSIPHANISRIKTEMLEAMYLDCNISPQNIQKKF